MATTSKTSDKKYIESVGRRKTAVARVRITEAGKNNFTVNGREMNEYFATDELQAIAREALLTPSAQGSFKISANITGGGSHAQAEAMRHGISRALVKWNAELRKELKKAGFLKRDPRSKERKKFGLKKARRAPQWSKR